MKHEELNIHFIIDLNFKKKIFFLVIDLGTFTFWFIIILQEVQVVNPKNKKNCYTPSSSTIKVNENVDIIISTNIRL